eukprot:2145732-Rhodomonas_salina.1
MKRRADGRSEGGGQMQMKEGSELIHKRRRREAGGRRSGEDAAGRTEPLPPTRGLRVREEPLLSAAARRREGGLLQSDGAAGAEGEGE